MLPDKLIVIFFLDIVPTFALFITYFVGNVAEFSTSDSASESI